MSAPVTCGNCGRSWCEKRDPAPAALCHWCHGRGYSLAPIVGGVEAKPVRWAFECSGFYDGVSYGDVWNGWDVVYITPATLAAVVAEFREHYSADDQREYLDSDGGLATLKPGDDGLILLNGLCTVIYTPEEEARELARDPG